MPNEDKPFLETSKNAVRNMALQSYVDRECSICSRLITRDEIDEDSIVCSGHSADGMLLAHRHCYNL